MLLRGKGSEVQAQRGRRPHSFPGHQGGQAAGHTSTVHETIHKSTKGRTVHSMETELVLLTLALLACQHLAPGGSRLCKALLQETYVVG